MQQSENLKSRKQVFIESLEAQAQKFADANGLNGFWAKHFVSEWLEIPHGKTAGLPPALVIGIEGGRTRAMGAMVQSLRQKFSEQRQQL